MLLLLSSFSSVYVLPCDTVNSGALYLLRESLGPVGAVRASSCEEAFETVQDTVAPDASAEDVLDALDDKEGIRARMARFGAPRRPRSWERDGAPATKRDGARGRTMRALGRAISARDGAFPEGYGMRPNSGPTPESAERRARLLARFGARNVYAARVSPFYSEDLNGSRVERLTRELAEELRLSVELEEEEIPEGTIIHGTGRFEDTIPALFEAASELGVARLLLEKDDYTDARRLTLDGSDDTRAERIASWTPERAPELLCALLDGLTSICPEGWECSAHPGDGSDLGFWRTDEATEEEGAPC